MASLGDVVNRCAADDDAAMKKAQQDATLAVNGRIAIEAGVLQAAVADRVATKRRARAGEPAA